MQTIVSSPEDALAQYYQLQYRLTIQGLMLELLQYRFCRVDTRLAKISPHLIKWDTSTGLPSKPCIRITCCRSWSVRLIRCIGCLIRKIDSCLLPKLQPTWKKTKNCKYRALSLFIARLQWLLLLLAVISYWEDATKLSQFQPWTVPHWICFVFVFVVFVFVIVFVLLCWIQPWQVLHLRFHRPGPCQIMQMCPCAVDWINQS